MTYPTYDSLGILTTQEIASAQPLTFKTYIPTGTYPNTWDLEASVMTGEPYAILRDLFSFTAVEDVTYDFFSFSFFDPFLIRVYDNLGRVIAFDRESDGNYGMDHISNFVAPYSGTMYVDAGWNQGYADANKYVSLYVNANVDTVPKPTNTLIGTDYTDRFVATKSSDLVNGFKGVDTMVYAGKRSDYNIVKNADVLTVSSNVKNEGTDILRSMEKLVFADRVVDTQYGELTQALYIGYFGRAADVGGLTSFQDQLSSLGSPTSATDLSARYARDPAVKNLIDSFGTSAESKALYSGDTKTFVKAVFNNVLNRDPQAAGLDFWTKAIDSGSLTRANASLSILAGAQTNTSAQGLNDALLVNNKISVASNFTFGLETDGKAASYNGLAAAAVARDLLKSVTASTDANTFQSTVKLAVAGLPAVPRSAPEHAQDLPLAQFDGPAIALTGLDSYVTAPAFSA
ncbi:DUF4214 domain-containing protein [Massilia pseudoviolaceinigra]|uniref:DUF4214 domain-containing protein n=1 Tax=Massilia pseudoviolaceinigra TaxID=3057165 RepID=UPI00279690E5|nr:DUF4214 domain-containing protein [Massilia sp. CCM 9206]MDQ1919321.1 DUF4214 domain-containing protein [Massilia sp. CCM 9206]